MDETQTRLQSPIVKAPMLERRAWVRYASSCDVACQSSGSLKDAGWPGKVLDVSLGGIGLLLRHRFPPGAPLIVELKGRAAISTEPLPCESCILDRSSLKGMPVG